MRDDEQAVERSAQGPGDGLCPEELGHLRLTSPKAVAVGWPAVLTSLAHVAALPGLARGLRSLAVVNQKGGVDCPSCAWPDPDGSRSPFEFCENGAKALAWEADRRRIGREFFARYSIDELARQSDYWHGQQGRLVEPLVLRPGERHYQPITWDDAFALIADELRRLGSPDEAAFYTSGRTSNEAAFLYQLFGRQFGTNNFPDCSNMCHESSGSALAPTLGIGKGTVTLDDFTQAELILILGQNPGTNHPRMLTTLQAAKRAGARIIAINPLREAGLIAFRNPQQVRGLLGFATPLADEFLRVKIGGDQALLKGAMKRLLDRNAIDREFITQQTDGFESLRDALNAVSWDEIVEQSGLSRETIERFADQVGQARRIIACWAMGLTQHKHAVATIQDLVNLLLLRGSVGKPGAGVCPVRGHSNVQGDRTMGIWEKPPEWLLDNLAREFDFAPPRHHGLDTVAAIKAMHAGQVKVFFALGGNFLSAAPDTVYTAEALKRCRLTAHVSIKLNRSHLVTGRTALILPCLGRTERDIQATGEQFVSTENSMGVVQMSRGTLPPASDQLLSEVAIVCRLARAVLGPNSRVPWEEFAANYDLIRDRIARVIPGFEDYNRRVRQPAGFYLPNRPREGSFPTATGKARLTTSPLPEFHLLPGQLVMMTIRSHDQFNTTVYGLDDRYRGIHNERRVILMNPEDITARGLKAGDVVHLISHFQDAQRVVHNFRVVAYDIPRGCCASYFPETNALVPIDSVADVSHTPTSKFIVVTVERAGAGPSISPPANEQSLAPAAS